MLRKVPDTNLLNVTFTPRHQESAPPVDRVAETSPKSDSTPGFTKRPVDLTQGWYTESTPADIEFYRGRLFKKTSPPYRPLFQRKNELISSKTDHSTTAQKSVPVTQSKPSSTSTQVTTQTSKLKVKTSTAIQKKDERFYATRTTLSSTTPQKTSRSSATRGTGISARQTQKPETNISPEVDETVADEEDDGFDYDIAFHNVTIKLVPGTPYPKQIQCGFANSLKINHQVNAIPSGDIHLSNKGNSINIRFHVNFTSIKISVMKPNSSKENESCEFQIHNNQDIKVVVPPAKNTSKSNTDLQIKNKIDNTLISMVTERITHHLKPLVCLPLDLCSQSVQMVDQFFGNFVDNVLNKCSLRRNTNTTIST